MKDHREFINMHKKKVCSCGAEGALFVQRVVSGYSERLYEYVEHGKRTRHYLGLASKYVTGRKCSKCSGRQFDTTWSECYKCRTRRRIMQNTAARVAGVS